MLPLKYRSIAFLTVGGEANTCGANPLILKLKKENNYDSRDEKKSNQSIWKNYKIPNVIK